MQRKRISLRRATNPILSAVPLGELGVVALSELPGAIDLQIEYETLFTVEVSFVWIGCGVPAVSDRHLKHFGLERSD